MSVVATMVYHDHIQIASDSGRFYGYTQEKNQSKLFKINNIIFGGVGWTQENGLMRLFLSTHQPREATEDAFLEFMGEFHDWITEKTKSERQYQLHNDYHFILDQKAFVVCNGYNIHEITNYHAIGAASDFALAAMYLGKSAEQAVGVACHHSIYAELPIKSFYVLKGQ